MCKSKREDGARTVIVRGRPAGQNARRGQTERVKKTGLKVASSDQRECRTKDMVSILKKDCLAKREEGTKTGRWANLHWKYLNQWDGAKLTLRGRRKNLFKGRTARIGENRLRTTPEERMTDKKNVGEQKNDTGRAEGGESLTRPEEANVKHKSWCSGLNRRTVGRL